MIEHTELSVLTSLTNFLKYGCVTETTWVCVCECVHVFAGVCEVIRASPNIHHHHLAGKTGTGLVTWRLHNLAVDSLSAEKDLELLPTL